MLDVSVFFDLSVLLYKHWDDQWVVVCYIDSDLVEWKNCYKYHEAKRCLTIIYQAWDAVFYHQMKHREESWKYDAQRSIFWRTSMCFIWWWNTLSNAWYYFSNKMILEGEIKDAKMSSFSSDFQTLIKLQFPLYFLYELLMSLRRCGKSRYFKILRQTSIVKWSGVQIQFFKCGW